MNQKTNTGLMSLLIDPKSIAGIIISIGGIYWAFRDFQFSDFKASIQEVEIIYLVIAQDILSLIFDDCRI